MILFGFLNGVWLAVGVNPGRELLGVARGIVETFVRGAAIEILFVVVPLLLLAASVWLIWRRGRWLGFVAVGVAFVGGAEILASPTLALGLLLLGLVLGVLATA